MTDLTNRAESITKFGESSSSSVDQNDKWARKTYGYEVGEHFVGMKDYLQLLESLITNDNNGSNRVLSICGMGGLGKTTLATKIYNRESVQRCFEVRAWICISQQFQLKTVLQELLKKFLPNVDDKMIGEMEEDELATKLFGVQTEKKFLVVVDDIWEIDDLNSLSRFFRIAEDRCRILVTTRNEKIGAAEYYVHKLQYLSEDEGWELLQMIALPINNSQELPATQLNLMERIGREIVRKCGCLPLAISVIGGILRQEKTSTGWEKVRKNIDSYLQRGNGVEVNKRVTQVLDLSYNALPYYLKPCFIYLGCFPEDIEIRTEELYLLWIAEGMVSSQDRGRNETLTEVAERYLCELANRCMVQVMTDEYSTYNRFQSCSLHDLMRDLCLSKGKEEGLLDVVDTEMGRQDAFSVSWLAIHLSKPRDDICEYKNLRSLMFSMKSTQRFRHWNSLVSVNFGMLKSLKILILQGFIHKMRRLRHLFLPKYMRKLIGGGKLKLDGLDELETLIGFNSKADDITHLLKLEKLRVLNGAIHDEYSLSMIVDHILNHQNQFRRTEFNIEGGCNMMMNSDVEGDSSSLLRKTLMCHSLSFLRIDCPLNKLPSYEHQLGKNLLELILWECYISEDSMEMLEKLPILRELQLNENAFVGREMVCRANGFPQLTELHLRGLPNLLEWRVEVKALRNLSFLQIYACKKLEMVPEGLKFITTLKQLVIEDMPEEFIDRVKSSGRSGRRRLP